MRLETKIGAAITVLALGAVAGFFAWRGTNSVFPPQPTASQDEPMAPIAVAPSPEAAPTTGENTGTLASPPPIGLRDDAERSFRPKEIEPVVEPQPASTERTGISDVTAVLPPLGPPAVAPAPTEAPAVAVTFSETPKPAVADAQPAAAPPAEPTKEHIIEPGDNFSLLAVKYYGNGKYANLIAKANPDLDPKRLKLNTKVKIPPAPVAAAPADATATPAASSAQPPAAAASTKTVRVSEAPPPVPADRAYKVQPGESWNDLGKKFLGDGQRWPELYELNKERVPHNPRNLRPGVVIEVPATKPS